MSAVAVEGVWKYYGDYPAIRNVNLRIEAGTCLALLGRNGAGKTTLLRMLAGFSKAGKGTILVYGKETRDPETRRRVGVLGHGITVYDELSALENLTLFGKLYGLPDPKSVARQWLGRVGLDRVEDGLVREFSRGMRQRLALARAFLHEPELLLLDEPFTSLDDRAIAVLQRVLSEGRERGRTIIMSTHQLREALELASHVALLNRGKLGYFGERSAEMLADPSYLYRTHGEA